jgi:hypothetical protein
MAGIGSAHFFPSELAGYVIARVRELGAPPLGLSFPADTGVLEAAISVAYQVSLLRDEDRPLTFRLAVAPPDAFSDEAGPPTGVHRLRFSSARELSVQELRKLSAAAKFSRSVVGTYVIDERLVLWGLLHTGRRWLERVRGGRTAPPDLPRILLVHVNGPGNLLVSVGDWLTIPTVDVFESEWLAQMFAPMAIRIGALYDELASESPGWPKASPDLVRRIGQSFLRRVIAMIRMSRHGGSLLFVPSGSVDEVRETGLVEIKYSFEEAEPRARFCTLIMAALERLAEELSDEKNTIGWNDYEAALSPAIAEIDEGLMELAHLVAGLAEVDGLVVMTPQLDVRGFGGVISGKLPEVQAIARAQDLEGTSRVPEPTDGMGTRHRAAYRIVAALPDALCVVVSQDGGVRFIRWHEGAVTCWDQVAAQTFG